jgi:hypothetical protein
MPATNARLAQAMMERQGAVVALTRVQRGQGVEATTGFVATEAATVEVCFFMVVVLVRFALFRFVLPTEMQV